MPVLKRATVAASLVFLSAAAGQGQTLSCPSPSKPMLRTEMMFGRNIGGRLGVGETAWRRFVAREIAPRFPAGLSVIDAQGQWRDTGDGRILREPSKIVMLVVEDEPRTRQRIAAIAEAYKKQFRQQSVGILTRPVCASF